MKGAKPHMQVARDALTAVPRVPGWLSEEARAEWRRIMPLLVERRILTDSDLAMVEAYCVAIGRVRALERAIQKADEIDAGMIRLQDKLIQTARQLAAELGLTPVSRSRPTMRESADNDSPLDL